MEFGSLPPQVKMPLNCSVVLEHMFDSSQLLIACMDAAFNLIRVNKAFASEHNKQPDFFSGRNYFSVFPSQDLSNIFREVMATGKSYQYTNEAREEAYTPDQGRRYLDWSLTPISGVSGERLGLLLVFTDVSERVHTEMRLLQAQRIGQVGIVEWDLRNDQIELSDNAYNILGIGKPVFEKNMNGLLSAIHPADRDRFTATLDHAMRNNMDSYEIEHRILNPVGQPRYVLSQGRFYCDKLGKPANVLGTLQDITELKLVEDTLRDKQRMMDQLIDNLPGYIYRVANDKDYTPEYISKYVANITGYSQEEYLVARTISCGKEVHPDDQKAVWDIVQDAISRQASYECSYRIITKQGETRWVWEHGHGVYDSDGALDHLEGFVMDITQRKRDEDELRIAAKTFDAHEAILITDKDANILRVNQAFEEITGYNAAEVIGKNPRIFKSGHQDDAFYQNMWAELLKNGTWSGEIWDKRKNGEIYPKSLTITTVYNDRNEISHYVAIFRDISIFKYSEQKIHQLAFYDHLTMLPNRRLFQEHLQHAIAVTARSKKYGAICFLDLDHFKTVNDTEGHALGDQLLIEIAERLQSCVREGDCVARLGGDEFVILLEDLGSDLNEAASNADNVVAKIRHRLDQPIILGKKNYASTVSMGIILFSGDTESCHDLLKHADVAMYEAKKSGRNAVRYYDPDMQARIDQRILLESDLRLAHIKKQLCLHYQVQVDHLGKPMGIEALLRWRHPQRGMVPSNDFIQVAEETGLIISIGTWVLQAACAQIKTWQTHPWSRNLKMSINISPRQFRHAQFVQDFTTTLEESGVNPEYVKIEITEGIVLENIEETIDKMRELRAIGVSFSMDDFGIGYSSLQYLKRLPLDQIKIDRSFIRNISTDVNDAIIVRTIIAMSKAMGLAVIAEGVESEDQRHFLINSGCNCFQGYLFSEPLPAEQFESMMCDMPY